MTVMINDYTLELGWSSKKVVKGIAALEKRLQRLNTVTNPSKSKSPSADPEVAKRKAMNSLEVQRLKLLSQAERKLTQVQLQEARLSKTDRGYKVKNALIQKNVHSMETYIRRISNAKITSTTALESERRGLRAVGKRIDANTVKMELYKRSLKDTPVNAFAGNASMGVSRGASFLGGGLMASALNPVAMGATATVVGLGLMAKGAYTASKQFQTLNISLQAAFGSAEEGARQLDYIRDIAAESKVELLAAGDAWAKLALSAKQSGMSEANAKKIFEGTTIAMRSFNLSADDTQGTYRALTQIMSKGQVTMEDFKGQIAERMPAAMGTMQKVLGVTAQEMKKMFEQGEIGSDRMIEWAEAMKQLAVGSGAYERSLNSLQAAETNFGNTLKESLASLYSLETEGGMARIIDGFSSAVKKATPVIKKLGDKLFMVAQIGSNIRDVFYNVVGIMGGLVKSVLGLTGASTLFGEVWDFIGRSVIDFWAILIRVNDYLDNFSWSKLGDQLVETFENAVKRVKEIWNGFKTWISEQSLFGMLKTITDNIGYTDSEGKPKVLTDLINKDNSNKTPPQSKSMGDVIVNIEGVVTDLNETSLAIENAVKQAWSDFTDSSTNLRQGNG